MSNKNAIYYSIIITLLLFLIPNISLSCQGSYSSLDSHFLNNVFVCLKQPNYLPFLALVLTSKSGSDTLLESWFILMENGAGKEDRGIGDSWPL